MKRSIKRRLAVLAATSLLAFAGAGAAGANDYVPFVTDFPRGKAPVEAYRPFATDFGIPPRPPGGGFTLPARGPHVDEPWTGSAWGDVTLGAGVGIVLAGLAAAGALAVRRHGLVLEPQGAARP